MAPGVSRQQLLSSPSDVTDVLSPPAWPSCMHRHWPVGHDDNAFVKWYNPVRAGGLPPPSLTPCAHPALAISLLDEREYKGRGLRLGAGNGAQRRLDKGGGRAVARRTAKLRAKRSVIIVAVRAVWAVIAARVIVAAP